MPIFLNAYATTIGSASITKNIETSIKEAIIKNNFNVTNLGLTKDSNLVPYFITGSLLGESEIPPFTHSITVPNFKGCTYDCTDMRLYISPEGKIKNKTECNFAKSRAVLNFIWQSAGPGPFKSSFQFAGGVFAQWISNAIANTFALDFKDKITLAVAASYYYQTLFYNDEITDSVMQKIAIHTINATKTNSQMVLEIFDRLQELGPIENISKFCSILPDLLENVRLNGFNLAGLLTVIRNSWYEVNAKEILSVALEHPPTWIAIVYTALAEKTYSTSTITKIAEKLNKVNSVNEFKLSYIDLIREFVPEVDDTIKYKPF